MFDDLHAYFYENVVSSYKEYKEEKNSGISGGSRDIRTALQAAESLFHLREHLPTTNLLTRSQVEKTCSDYGILGDIVNVSKHKFISNNTPHGSPFINKAEQIEELVVIIKYMDDKGEYESIEKKVIIKLINGTERDMLDVLTNVMNFWQNYLFNIGIIQNPINYTNTIIEPKSRNDCENNKLDIVFLAGVRFQQKMKLCQYNYQKNIIEPIDLTGYQISAKIYKTME